MRVAFLNDPDVPDYEIHLLNGGTEIEVTGGMKYGLAGDFKKISQRVEAGACGASRQRRRTAGRGGCAQCHHQRERTDDVRRREVHVGLYAGVCGGKQRILKKGAVLGFHRGVFGGEDQIDDRQGGIERVIFREAGFSPSFIDKALSTPNKEMWTPTTPSCSRKA